MSLKSNKSGNWKEYRYQKLRRMNSTGTTRHNDQGDVNMPGRSAHSKRATSRLNLSADKGIGGHKSLSSLEEEFIFAAEFGDIPTVQRILEEHHSFNVDYSDILGRTPLRLAVGNEHLEVVELLLDKCNISNIHEALLQAISAGHEQIAETILKHHKYKESSKDNKRFGEADYFYNTTSEDSPFSSDITPLILAAERNQFEIVQLLLLRGETIPKPHHYYCHCQECSNKLEFDQLRLAKTRLNAYKGLASGAYISLSSKDPILTSFELARELRAVAKVEKYFKNEYLSMADQLSEYVVKLLDKIRGHDELEILLNKTGADSSDESYKMLARLKMAIRYNEKKFVAHPSCQQKLVSIWYSDLRTLERANWFYRSLIVICITALYPVLAVLYWVAPYSLAGRFLRYPCVKFIGQSMSFIAFLAMILISTAKETSHRRLSYFPEVHHLYNLRIRLNQTQYPADFVLRTFEPESIHIVMTIWIAGMLWQELKQLYGEGVQHYFDSLYNYLDMSVLTLYVASFTLRYVCVYKVKQSLEYFRQYESWDLLLNSTLSARYQWYWLPADRYYWDSWDPYNMAEATFALANVISFSRVSAVLPTNELFGPMQISLARMITDILKFAVIFVVLFIAFMVGLHNLYWYYPKQVRGEVELFDHNLTTEAEKHFGIPDITFRTVFWSMLGRGEPQAVELDGYNNMFTQNVGYWIFGVYNVAVVIVLLNMLIAMMSRSFEIIQTFRTTFWSVLGRGEPEMVELGDYHNYFIQNVGYWIFGAYSFAIVIVLLNILIAMMSRSFDKIQAEADTEWKFSRSKLYMEYIDPECTLPVPFNIVPTPKFFYTCSKSITSKFSKQDDLPPVHHPGRIKDIEMFAQGNAFEVTPVDLQNNGRHDVNGPGIQHFRERMATTNGFVRNDSDPMLFNDKLTYKRVMKRIVKRYIFDTQREVDSTEGDFEELKQDISSFRYEMLNHLSKRQRESDFNSQMLEKINQRLDSLSSQQELIAKHLLGSSVVKSQLAITNDSTDTTMNNRSPTDTSNVSSDSTSKPYENFATNNTRSRLIGNLRIIPEEPKDGRELVARLSGTDDRDTETDVVDNETDVGDGVTKAREEGPAVTSSGVSSPTGDATPKPDDSHLLPFVDALEVEVQVNLFPAPLATGDEDERL